MPLTHEERRALIEASIPRIFADKTPGKTWGGVLIDRSYLDDRTRQGAHASPDVDNQLDAWEWEE